jgi:hypothetical protein
MSLKSRLAGFSLGFTKPGEEKDGVFLDPTSRKSSDLAIIALFSALGFKASKSDLEWSNTGMFINCLINREVLDVDV